VAEIILFCAHRREAEPFLQLLNLDRVIEDQVLMGYTDQHGECALFLTGQGPLRAAAAVASVLALYPSDQTRVIGNFGTAGAFPDGPPVGQAVLINRVQDQASGSSYYPDRLLLSPWPETTCLTLHRAGHQPESMEAVVDMELAGIASAATLFVSSSQLVFGKLVSDHLGSEPPDWKEMFAAITEPYSLACKEFVELLRAQRELLVGNPRHRRIERAVERTQNAMKLLGERFTVTQSRQLEIALKALSLSTEEEQWARALSSLEELLAGSPTISKPQRAELFDRLLGSLQASGSFSGRGPA